MFDHQFDNQVSPGACLLREVSAVRAVDSAVRAALASIVSVVSILLLRGLGILLLRLLSPSLFREVSAVRAISEIVDGRVVQLLN